MLIVERFIIVSIIAYDSYAKDLRPVDVIAGSMGVNPPSLLNLSFRLTFCSVPKESRHTS